MRLEELKCGLCRLCAIRLSVADRTLAFFSLSGCGGSGRVVQLTLISVAGSMDMKTTLTLGELQALHLPRRPYLNWE
jgi:hypothetical protein